VRQVVPFLRGLTGLRERPPDAAAWLPHLSAGSFLGQSWQERLFDAGQGDIFHDPGGHFTALWREWTAYVPEDVQRALLARGLFRVWNAGPEYNLTRIHARGDALAFSVCLARYVDEVMSLAFTLEDRYVPYYKWRVAHFRRLHGVPERVRRGLDSLVAEHDSARRLALAWDILDALKARILERYPLPVGDGARLSWFAHQMRATIQDEAVCRFASLDW
jgi:hypothetical protein